MKSAQSIAVINHSTLAGMTIRLSYTQFRVAHV